MCFGFVHIWAQDEVIIIHHSKGVKQKLPINALDFVEFLGTADTLCFCVDSMHHRVCRQDIDSITFGYAHEDVRIDFSNANVTVHNPYAFRGVDIQILPNNSVVVYSQLNQELTYTLKGQGVGSVKFYNAAKQRLVLDGLQLTSADGPAIQVQSGKKTTVVLPPQTGNSITDAPTYTLVEGEDMKGALFSEGQLVFEDEGVLCVAGRFKHAICSDDYVAIHGGNICITEAAGDGINANDYFEMKDGVLSVSNTLGDCVDAGEGYATVSGGNLVLKTTGANFSPGTKVTTFTPQSTVTTIR